MNPTLKITERGTERWIAGEPTPAPPTALARIDVDSVVKQSLDQQSSAVMAYLRTVGSAAQKTVDAAPARSATGYSNADELTARNRRFYFTVLAYVVLAVVVAYGLVQLAILADVLDSDWWLGAFLTLTGALALALTYSTHRLEAHLTPEGIQSTLAGADAYATERNADAQHVIATAVADAIRWRAESEHSDSVSRQLATESMFASMGSAPTPRRLTMAPTPMATDDAMLTYATNIDVQSHTAAPQADAAPQWTVRPMQPDSGALALCEAVAAIYADCRHRGDNLIVRRLEWSQRGSWSAAQKRKAIETLAQLDPPLLLAGDGGRWRLNVADWHEQIALSAIRRRWR